MRRWIASSCRVPNQAHMRAPYGHSILFSCSADAFREIIDGSPDATRRTYALNQGDAGVLVSLDRLPAGAASATGYLALDNYAVTTSGWTGEDFQRQGVGRAVVLRAIEEMKARGVTTFHVDCKRNTLGSINAADSQSVQVDG
jgi:GNAT superfamily N-acetyltransferase